MGKDNTAVLVGSGLLGLFLLSKTDQGKSLVGGGGMGGTNIDLSNFGVPLGEVGNAGLAALEAKLNTLTETTKSGFAGIGDFNLPGVGGILPGVGDFNLPGFGGIDLSGFDPFKDLLEKLLDIPLPEIDQTAPSGWLNKVPPWALGVGGAAIGLSGAYLAAQTAPAVKGGAIVTGSILSRIAKMFKGPAAHTAAHTAEHIAVKAGTTGATKGLLHAIPVVGQIYLLADAAADVVRLFGVDVTEWLGFTGFIPGENPLEKAVEEGQPWTAGSPAVMLLNKLGIGVEQAGQQSEINDANLDIDNLLKGLGEDGQVHATETTVTQFPKRYAPTTPGGFAQYGIGKGYTWQQHAAGMDQPRFTVGEVTDKDFLEPTQAWIQGAQGIGELPTSPYGGGFTPHEEHILDLAFKEAHYGEGVYGWYAEMDFPGEHGKGNWIGVHKENGITIPGHYEK